MMFTNNNSFEETEEFVQNYINQFPFLKQLGLKWGSFISIEKNYEKSLFCFLIIYLPSILMQQAFYANKAACYEALEQWQKAIEVYEEQLELEYTKAFTFYRIGLCYKADKKNLEALRAFQNL